jgi:hypothetical protein
MASTPSQPITATQTPGAAPPHGPTGSPAATPLPADVAAAGATGLEHQAAGEAREARVDVLLQLGGGAQGDPATDTEASPAGPVSTDMEAEPTSALASACRRAKLRIGFICGQKDEDWVRAPGIPREYWESEEPKHAEAVCADIALWWHVAQNYPGVVTDRIPGTELSARRLQANDINLLIGYDAVTAQIEEFGSGRGGGGAWIEPGHSERVAALLQDPASKVWPPGEIQAFVNIKSNYLRRCVARGIPIAPTEIQAAAQDVAAASASALTTARARGWRTLVAKPVPSSWCLAIGKFDVDEQMRSLQAHGQPDLSTPPAAAGADTARQSSAPSGGTTQTAAAHRPSAIAEYFGQRAVVHAHEVLLQEFVPGLSAHPETRAFFFGHDYLYAVANSVHDPDDGSLTVRSSPIPTPWLHSVVQATAAKVLRARCRWCG